MRSLQSRASASCMSAHSKSLAVSSCAQSFLFLHFANGTLGMLCTSFKDFSAVCTGVEDHLSLR